MSTPQLSFVLVKHSKKQSTHSSQQDIQAFLGKFQIPHEILEGLSHELPTILKETQAPYIVISNAELTSPLGDALKMIQALSSSPELDIVFGNRFKKKDSPFHGDSPSPRVALDQLYTDLFKKNLSNLFEDPLCDLVTLRQSFVNKISEAQLKELSNIRWTPYLQRLSLETKARTADVPIYDNGQTSADWPSFKRKFQMMWLSSKFF